jgi:hypothetical protein
MNEEERTKLEEEFPIVDCKGCGHCTCAHEHSTGKCHLVWWDMKDMLRCDCQEFVL